ncbi:MAG: hypothetical protein ACFFDW_11275 [Candidatus Thorarchaeota archaeon]
MTNSEKLLQIITDRIPIQITKKAPFIFNIQSKNSSFYLSAAKLNIKSNTNTNGFTSLLRDFVSVLPVGQFNIDITNTSILTEENQKNIANTGITILLENKDLEKVLHAQKHLNKMMQLINDEKSLIQPISLHFVDFEELQSNFGKIIFNQGWDYFEGSYEGVLNFELFFNLLSREKTSES